MKTPLLLTLAAAVGLPLASAQEERKPENPPRPPDPERQPGPRPDGPGERRPDGGRPSLEPADRRPDGDRGPGQRAQPNDLRRTEVRRPDGDRREGQRFELQLQDAHDREWKRADVLSYRQRPQKPTAYLGIVTAAVAPALAAQLGLPEGFGLVVEEVIPDSPAARAGVQRFDVLKLLNDQQLIDPNQLATLVRSAGKDAEVSLTVLRKGGEQKLTVKVGERMLPERRPLISTPIVPNPPVRERVERGAREMQDRMEKWRDEFAVKMKEYNERMKEYGSRLREFHERGAKEPRDPSVTPPQPPQAPKAPEPPQFDSPPAPADLLKEVRPGGAPGVRIEQDGNVTLWNTANARAVIKDEEGVVELRSEDGKRSITARDASGNVSFDGPIDTDEQRATLPAGVRRKLQRMDAQARVRVDAPRPAVVPVPAPPSGAVSSEAALPPEPAEREVQ